MIQINDQLEKYILDHSDKEDKILYELYRETNLKVLNPRMISGHLQGKILEFISKMISPEHILEIGTYTGYSAICLAKGLKPGGQLHTIEINDEILGIPKRYIAKLKLQDKIKFYCGDALEIIEKIDKSFDLVFIDADKRQYVNYYNKLFDKVKQGGYILVDNVLWGGKVIDEKDDDESTIGIRQFNRLIKKDNRIEKVILPIRDGLFLIRKKQK